MESQKIEWHEYKDALVGFQSKRIVAVIEKTEGLPVEAFAVNFIEGCFVDIDSAKEATEKLLNEHTKHRNIPTYAETVLPILKQVVVALENKEENI